jgi:uridine kinase
MLVLFCLLLIALFHLHKFIDLNDDRKLSRIVRKDMEGRGRHQNSTGMYDKQNYEKR